MESLCHVFDVWEILPSCDGRGEDTRASRLKCEKVRE